MTLNKPEGDTNYIFKGARHFNVCYKSLLTKGGTSVDSSTGFDCIIYTAEQRKGSNIRVKRWKGFEKDRKYPISELNSCRKTTAAEHTDV